jgi:hypothetical protein
MLHPDAALELEVLEATEPHQLLLSEIGPRLWPSAESGRRVYLLGGSARQGAGLCLGWNDEERICHDIEQEVALRFDLANLPIVLSGCDLESRVLRELMNWTAVHAPVRDHPIFILGESAPPASWTGWGAVRTISLHPVFAFAELSRIRGRIVRASGPAPSEQFALRPERVSTNPYKFLDSNGPEDEELFHGRDQDGEQLRMNLWTSRDGLSVLSGKSGVGKTSLVRAWLIPRLKRERDTIAVFCRFGDDPRPAILAQLSSALEERGRALEASHLRGAFPELLTKLSRTADAEILIVIDQLEEAIILRGEVREFIVELRQFLANRPSTARVLLVIRADFLGWLAHFHTGAIESSFRLAELSRAAARRAVLEPSHVFSMEIEDGFVDALLDDLDPERILPANLQIVLNQMLQSAGPKRLDLEDKVRAGPRLAGDVDL